MKNLCASVLIISGVIINFQSYSQIYTSEIEVTNSTNGNVGIGTNTPIAPLYLLSSQSNQGFKIGATGMSTVISLHVSSGNYGYFHLGGNTSLRGNGQSSSFGGNLGIGTASPTSTLHVYQNGNGWLQQIKGVATNTGESVGLRLMNGYSSDNGKWAGIAAMAENLHSNDTGLGLFADQLERVRIKANGNVGIGTTNPSRKLDVKGSGHFEVSLSSSGNDGPIYSLNTHELGQMTGDYSGNLGAFIGKSGSRIGLHIYNIRTNNNSSYWWHTKVRLSSNVDGGSYSQTHHYNNLAWIDLVGNGYGLEFGTGTNSPWMVIKNSGRVGIGNTSPGYLLDVNGTARVTTLIQSSDERLKKDIRAFSSDDKMNNLSVYKYKLKGEIQSAVTTSLGGDVPPAKTSLTDQGLTKDHIGLLAQEVEAIYPDLVYTDAQGYKAIDYSQFIPILIDRTNKQQTEINQLKKEMAELKILITSNK